MILALFAELAPVSMSSCASLRMADSPDRSLRPGEMNKEYGADTLRISSDACVRRINEIRYVPFCVQNP